jgi:hypothetical protein
MMLKTAKAKAMHTIKDAPSQTALPLPLPLRPRVPPFWSFLFCFFVIFILEAKKRGRPEKTLDEYIREHDWLHASLGPSVRKCYPEKEDRNVPTAFCRHCPNFLIYIEMKNISKSINEHMASSAHRSRVEGVAGTPSIANFTSNRLETPEHFQDMCVLALTRDGLSVEFTQGEFFQGFLMKRFPQFQALQSLPTLRSRVVPVVKAEDFELKTLLKDQMFWFGMDETPDSANRPLIHGSRSTLAFAGSQLELVRNLFMTNGLTSTSCPLGPDFGVVRIK